MKSNYTFQAKLTFVVAIFIITLTACDPNKKEKEEAVRQQNQLQAEFSESILYGDDLLEQSAYDDTLNTDDIDFSYENEKDSEANTDNISVSEDLDNSIKTDNPAIPNVPTNDLNKKSLAQLYDEQKSSVFLVLAEDNQGISQGSGFFISADGIAVSNYHVFKETQAAVIHTSDKQNYLLDKVLYSDPTQDLIIFKVFNPNNKAFRPVVFANNRPKIGESCFAIGNPKGLQQTLSTGIVSGFREGNMIQISAPIASGSSGGALFNQSGEVIGITTSGIIGNGDLNFALNMVNFNLEKTLSDTASAESTETIQE